MPNSLEGFVVALALVVPAQGEPPPEWEVWTSAVVAHGHSTRCLEEAVPSALWAAYRSAARTSMFRGVAARNAAGFGTAVPSLNDYAEIERRAPREAGFFEAATHVETAAQEALEAVAPSEYRDFAATKKVMETAALALAVVTGGKSGALWPMPEPGEPEPCR